MSYMKHIDQLWNYKLDDGTVADVVSFEAGVTTGDLYDDLAGSGRTVVTARYRQAELSPMSESSMLTRTVCSLEESGQASM